MQSKEATVACILGYFAISLLTLVVLSCQHSPSSIPESYQLIEWQHLGELILFHTVIVALPEETFFRGYLQTRIDDLFKKCYVPVGNKQSNIIATHPLAILIQAIMFSMLHVLIYLDINRISCYDFQVSY